MLLGGGVLLLVVLFDGGCGIAFSLARSSTFVGRGFVFGGFAIALLKILGSVLLIFLCCVIGQLRTKRLYFSFQLGDSLFSFVTNDTSEDRSGHRAIVVDLISNTVCCGAERR